MKKWLNKIIIKHEKLFLNTIHTCAILIGTLISALVMAGIIIFFKWAWNIL